MQNQQMPKQMPTATMEHTMKIGRSRKNGRTSLEKFEITCEWKRGMPSSVSVGLRGREYWQPRFKTACTDWGGAGEGGGEGGGEVG